MNNEVSHADESALLLDAVALPAGSTVFAPVSSAPLTLTKVLETMAVTYRESLAYTRGFWQALAREHGSEVMAICHPSAILEIERQCMLLAEGRPSWLHVTKHALDEMCLFFVRCGCLCHQPSEGIPLPSRLACCTCSAKEREG